MSGGNRPSLPDQEHNIMCSGCPLPVQERTILKDSLHMLFECGDTNGDGFLTEDEACY